ncbi:2OGFeDO, oxygenase domain containing protein [uncultured Caudovirales phage]|uniref:2OGFeDO, oxygenase domain containing protein n=1 Tax=uncultured Caudovirales phage TaxID=2100421 RepID=A0A6J5NXG1_9CAUD|nr:2OGFeDO, oxygenase domain containing protein [uncultured Caudovirales phage]
MKDYTNIAAERIVVSKRITDAQTSALVGTMLGEDPSVSILDRNADVYCADTGDCLLKFRKGLIPNELVKSSYRSLYHAASVTDNRGMATGLMNLEQAREVAAKHGWILDEERFLAGGDPSTVKRGAMPRKTLDGRPSSVARAARVLSGIVGYMNADVRFPYCRMTAFTQSNFDKFAQAYPIIKLVDEVYASLMPEPYARQRALADASSKDYVIKDTAFTTVTVNRNWQTACHTDKGDFVGGFGNLTVLRRGDYSGGFFILPQYGIGVDMQNTDVLLVDVHRVHGNTPIVKHSADATRISLVMYYREGMERCGSSANELVKARKVMRKRQMK